MRWSRALSLMAVVSLGFGLGGCKPEEMGSDSGMSASCAPGTQGCECVADRCGRNGRGEQLVCMGGTCETMSCPAGESGCVCRGGTACNAPGDSCTEGFCLAAGCTPGGANCGCVAGTCDVGLICLEGAVCADSTGYEGGRCLSSGGCYRGNRCDPATGSCVFCDPGTAGCQCTTNNGCNAGMVCTAGVCLSGSQLPPPSPACYTPCSNDLVIDGGARIVCGPEGLLDGCLPTQTCDRGSCVSPGGTRPSCISDLECPFFQVCLQGGCYSNCNVNADCQSGTGCVAHACRPACRLGQNQSACPTGMACTSDDGQNGYCLAVGRSQNAASTPVTPTGGLKLPIERLELSNVRQTAEAIVVPQSQISQDITVRKLWHQTTDSNGNVERVDAPRTATGEYRTCNGPSECPLWWLGIGSTGTAPTQTPTTSFRLLPGCVDDVTRVVEDAGSVTRCPRIKVANAGGVSAVRWEGALEITSGDSRTQLLLTYVQRPDGQWTGSMYYFGSFDRAGMEGWITRATKSDTNGVSNALVQRWGTLRRGNLEGWQEFLAVLTATRTESWKFGEVKNRCSAANNGNDVPRCYPYLAAGRGVRTYTINPRNNPIPSGVTELPIAMNLQINAADPVKFTGRIESSMAMHYPGNPSVKMEFEASPADANACFMGGGTDCMVFLKGIQAVASDTNRIFSTVGGRTLSTDGTCPGTPGDFEIVKVPWLVPGFYANTMEAAPGIFERQECRDARLPFDAQIDGRYTAINKALAGGNPVPDGNPRRRTLRFIDGALVNQSEIFILFEESYQSFIPPESGQPDAPTTAYGYMRLKRAAADLDQMDYVGAPTANVARTGQNGGATCSPELLSKFGLPANPSSSQLAGIAKVLMAGYDGSSQMAAITTANQSTNQIHYWCEDTGFFNGGPQDDGSSTATRRACPVGSRVVFFNAGSNKNNAQMAAEACQTRLKSDGRASCFDTLEGWRNSGVVISEYEPFYRCTNSVQGVGDGGVNDVFCDDNRLDLRSGKTFFIRAMASPRPKLTALRPLIDSAFRYKTRFRSTTGGALGFAPRMCVPGSDAVPYCYDPKEVEEARERVDCLVSIYSQPGAVTGALFSGDPATRSELTAFLRANFSSFAGSRSNEGFERLYVELLIMQGDEALTSAYASRFDLAAAGGATFRGSLFEAGGIDLTGVAGAEMFNLYLSVQYYQLALDRLYKLGPNMRTALTVSNNDINNQNSFLSPETVTTYLERLVRAAAQKSRAWGEIARRYQNFNRPDLARAVIERAYVGTYLESALIARLMLDISASAGNAYQDQLTVTLEKAQRSYRMALLDMREVYGQITDEVNYFGYPADYIPFPPLDSSSVSSASAYETLSTLAQQRLDLAKTREQVALAAGKQGRVDAAQFQSDLTSIRNNYENQLSQICGVFTGADGRSYPAIRKYAFQSQVATMMGDPCGRMGNGEIHNSIAAVKDGSLRIKGVLQRHENILQDVAIERQKVTDVCGLMNQQVDYQFERQSQVIAVQDEMARQRAMMSFIGNSVAAVLGSLEILDCEIQCASSAAMAATSAAVGIAAAGATYASELRLATKQKELAEFDADTVQVSAGFACAGGLLPDGGTRELGILNVESNARVASMLNDTLEVEIEALRAEYSMRVSMADVTRLFGNAQRLQAQQEEAEQLAIDIQQAQNDPNVRIYQNDAIINADVSFKDALATAYRLTRVFEYYTSQSYAKKEQLFLIRMITAGQYNLENYLLELDNEFIAFEEQFGNPDVRVIALSLRDDILQIPYLNESGTPFDENTRIEKMREKLRDVKMLDSRGYLTIPFSTDLKKLSPVTRNHKVRHVEVDMQGVKMGDQIARVYLRMSGTGVVRNVADDIDYYVFPERLAVINASVLGLKPFDPEVYRNYRFRDRPLVNTLWELVINQRDEAVNKDIDLQSLTDIRVLVYYSDFTSF